MHRSGGFIEAGVAADEGPSFFLLKRAVVEVE
jgi:hypothetical protein